MLHLGVLVLVCAAGVFDFVYGCLLVAAGLLVVLLVVFLGLAWSFCCLLISLVFVTSDCWLTFSCLGTSVHVD